MVLRKVLKVIENIVFGLLLLVALLVLISLLPIKNNYKLYSVMSGSMEPAIKVGSMIVSQPVEAYFEGDIITFFNNNSTKDTTTHRIEKIEKDEWLTRYYTKGDANENIDGKYTTDEKIIGKQLFSIPYLGYLIGYIKTLPGLILIIIIPATVITYEEIRKMRDERLKVIKKREAKKTKKTERKGENDKKN